MLPEMSPDVRIASLESRRASISIFGSDNRLDANILRAKADMVSRGAFPIDLIASDSELKELIELCDVEYMVKEGLPLIEKGIATAEWEAIKTAITEGMRISDAKKNQEKKGYYEWLQSQASEAQYTSIVHILNQLTCDFSLGGPSKLRVDNKPQDILFVKGLAPTLVLSAAQSQGKFSDLNAKLQNEPFVVSTYTGDRSMTFSGIGVVVDAVNILQSFVTDANSGETTVVKKPKAEVINWIPQFTTWDEVHKFSDSEYAARLNSNPLWYPEFWITREEQIRSVFIRPMDALVSRSRLTGYDSTDHHRAIAAVMLSQSLGVPIEVLE